MQYSDFVADYLKFKAFRNKRFTLAWSDQRAILTERTSQTTFDRHYIYHPAWAARVVAKIKPKYHIDIASALSFSSILSAFVPVRFYDYRPANLKLSKLVSGTEDLMRLSFKDNSVISLSCMHTIEHVGLGRYGDKLDPDGDLKAISELKRVVAKNGNLLFVVPIGKPRIVFNAHRIYSVGQILAYFSDLKLVEFSLIPDNPSDGGLIANPSHKYCDSQNYACGCFWFKKI